MSFTSSHSKSHSVEILAHKSRVFSRPFRDSVSVVVVPLSDVSGHFGTADALVLELLDLVDLSDSEQLCTDAFDQ
ncbi:hypothetical protein BHM03_00054751 [Ensete ventricosum]|nr:hypothetical protein BHM03_00054751 [Ensete ventricosum]